MSYKELFAPLPIGNKLTLKNRIVMAPMTTISGKEDGSFSSQEISYLEQRAKDGVGLVLSPACYCHKSGHAFERQVGSHSDEMIESLSRVADVINRHGAASFLQIHHGGNAAKEKFSGMQPIAPSAVHNRTKTSELPAEMTELQIEEIIESFAMAALRAKKAGWTGIELHGANTYLFQQFFSTLTNRRTDKWGGSFENRARFACEVVKAVRIKVGNDYPVAYRVSPEEPDPDGYSVYDCIKLLELIVPLGIDIVHVSSWEYGKGVRNDYPKDSHPTLEIRKALPENIPVIGVGSITNSEQAMKVINSGIELVAIGRALILNHDWVSKVEADRSDELIEKVSTLEELDKLQIPDRMKIYMRRWWFAEK